MMKTELKAFRKALEKRQGELGTSMGHREAMAIETSADVLDRIQDANDRDYAINNLELNSIRLREVQTALVRMDAGTFGTCSGCREIIGAKRLAAVPWASSCIVCQETVERERKTTGNEIETSLLVAA
jgi:DnaK suppressor protein